MTGGMCLDSVYQYHMPTMTGGICLDYVYITWWDDIYKTHNMLGNVRECIAWWDRFMPSTCKTSAEF